MGNGCCAEDRDVLTTEEKRESKDAIKAAKDVEANLPRLRQEITVIVKGMKTIDKDQQLLMAAISQVSLQFRSLTSEVPDLLSLARVILIRKSLHCTVSHNISILKKPSQSAEVLVAKVLEAESACNMQGAEWVSLLHDKDEERVSMEGDRVRRELMEKRDEVEQVRKRLKGLRQEMDDLRKRLSRNIQSTINSLSEDVSDFHRSKLAFLKAAIFHDSEIAKLSRTAKPSYLYERVLELTRELTEIKIASDILSQKITLCDSEINEKLKEMTKIEDEITVVLSDLKSRNDKLEASATPRLATPPPPPQQLDQSPLVRLDSMRDSLTIEERNLKFATENLSELHHSLASSQDSVFIVKARVFLLVVKFRHMRVTLQAIRMWRMKIELRKWQGGLKLIRGAEKRYYEDEEFSDMSEGVNETDRKIRVSRGEPKPTSLHPSPIRYSSPR